MLRAAGATEVWLFGSLATDAPGLTADVDLAVAGLPSARYFEVVAELGLLFATPIDLVLLEEAPPSLRQRVGALGRRL